LNAFKILLALAFLVATLLFLVTNAVADPGSIPCYYYGFEEEGKPTAFAESWQRPEWVSPFVRTDRMGIAVKDLRPGTIVRLRIVRLPSWADTWPELADLVGNTVLAVVSDRPGGDFVDCWPATWAALTGGRYWLGKVYVEVEVVRIPIERTVNQYEDHRCVALRAQP